MFDNSTPIYEQIKKMIIDNIIRGIWKEDELIPSVRQLSTELSVNPNTVMKALQDLQRDRVLENVRGMGNKVSKDRRIVLIEEEKQRFISIKISECIHNAKTLGISEQDFISIVLEHYRSEK